MRNFLNTTFKFLSRSSILTFIFLLSFGTTYAAPIIESFTVNNTEGSIQVDNDQGWTVRWEANNAAGCLIKSDEVFAGDSELPKWSSVSSGTFSGFHNSNDAGGLIVDSETFTYNITCYESVQETTGPTQAPQIVTHTSTNPYTGAYDPLRVTGIGGVSKTVTVTVIDQSELTCPTEGEGADICNAVCTTAPGTDACNACKGPNGTNSPQCRQAYQCISNGGNTSTCQTTAEGLNNATQPKDPDQSGGRCFPKLMGGAGFDVTGCIIDILDVTTVPLAASFLQLCAYIFEFAVQISIVQFSNLVSGNGDWLTSIWRTIRDVLNIFVIFILLYSAIKVIVGQGGEIKKLISGVILFGVLTNFSLFITKAAVDLSNIVALEFYQQMRNAPLSEARFSNGLGATIVGITGLTNLYDPQGAISGGSGISNTTTEKIAGTPLQNSIMYRIAMIFVFIAVAFVFLQAAFIFVARTLSIIVLLIFSPLMFAGGVFSPLKEWIDKWWKDFVGQIALAPVFMILLYVVLTILGSLVKATNSMTAERDDIYALLGLIILTSALTIFGFGLVIKTAREFSRGVGEKGVSKALGWGAQAAGLVGGFVGRNTMGRIGKSLLSGDSATGNALRENAAKNTLASRLFSRNILRAAGSASRSEFDVRSSPVGSGIGKIIDASNKYTKGNVQIDAGKATTAGGFAGRLKKDTEEQTKQDVATLKEREGLLKAEGDTREIKKANSDRKKAFEANGGYNREIFEATADFITGRGIKTSLVTGRATGQSVREDAITELKKKSKKSKNEDELKIWKKDLLRYTKFGTKPAEKFLPDDVEVNGKKVSDYKSKEDLEDALVELDEIDTKKLWEKVSDGAEAAPATNPDRSKALQRAKAAPSQISKLAETLDKEGEREEKKKEEKKDDKKDIKK